MRLPQPPGGSTIHAVDEDDAAMDTQRCAADDEPAVIRFEGELDAADDERLGELQQLTAGGATRIVVDLVNVSFVDSSVVRALVLAHRNTTSRGGWVRVVYTHHLIRRVIDICGLSEVLPQFTTVDAALRNAPTRQHPEDGPGPGSSPSIGAGRRFGGSPADGGPTS
jgi:anti-anti-sigma factor